MAKQGDTIGPYRLIRRLGQGTFKDVWLAVRVSRFESNEVALGLPYGEIDEAALTKEAVLWRSVSNHPNVNRLLEVDEYDGQIVIVSDYIDGGTLAKWLETNGAGPATRNVYSS